VAFNVYARSDAGLRDINEDNYCAERIGEYYVLAVADGLGGHAAGEVASSIAIECLRNALKLEGGDPRHALQEAVSEADKQIFVHAEKFPDSHGMATTFIAAVVDDELNCMVINVGDSRAHFITADEVTTTKDHSFVNQLVEAGEIHHEDTWKHPLSNVLCQAIGDPEVALKPDFYEADLRDTYLLLSSDGLHDFVREETIRKVVVSNRDDLQKSCEDLVTMALEAGSDDNITVVLFHGE